MCPSYGIRASKRSHCQRNSYPADRHGCFGTRFCGRDANRDAEPPRSRRHLQAQAGCRRHPDPPLSGGNSEASIRLVGELGEDLRGYIYGVTFVDPNLDFWELKFPPPPKWRVNFEAPLQCTSCQNHEVVDQSEVEADVYALAEFILRPCSICGTSTQWRRATEDDVAVPANPATRGLEARSRFVASPLQLGSARSGEPLAAVSQHRRLAGVAVPEGLPPEPLPPAATAAVAHNANRRHDVRARVSSTACVRQDSVDEIVECGNLSKGGFSLRRRKSYLAGSDIDVALPYSPGTQPAFVRATVRHSLVLPKQFPLRRHVRGDKPHSKIVVLSNSRRPVEATFPSQSTLFFLDHA
jgi:PilZ domain